MLDNVLFKGYETLSKEHPIHGEIFLKGRVKRIFVIDHSHIKKEIAHPVPITVKEEKPEEKSRPVEEFYSKRKKMTARQFILETLNGDVYSTEDLARKYIKEGYSKKLVTKVKNLMSTTISLLRKEGAPIIKIKAGRYGIRK